MVTSNWRFLGCQCCGSNRDFRSINLLKYLCVIGQEGSIDQSRACTSLISYFPTSYIPVLILVLSWTLHFKCVVQELVAFSLTLLSYAVGLEVRHPPLPKQQLLLGCWLVLAKLGRPRWVPQHRWVCLSVCLLVHVHRRTTGELHVLSLCTCVCLGRFF